MFTVDMFTVDCVIWRREILKCKPKPIIKIIIVVEKYYNI